MDLDDVDLDGAALCGAAVDGATDDDAGLGGGVALGAGPRRW